MALHPAGREQEVTPETINARATVAAEFDIVWRRATPGNKPNRSIAAFWFRSGRDCGLAAHAALERDTIKQLRARIADLEQLETADLQRRVRRLTEALTELHYCARQLRQAGRSGNEVKREAVRVDAAIKNAAKELK